MRRPTHISTAILAGAALMPLVPQGAAAAGNTTPYTYRPAQAKLPACAHAGKARPLPHGFPATFPLPPRSAITAVASLSGGHGARVSGFVPMATTSQAESFFLRELPQAGFGILMLDAEAGIEAESGFSGHNWVGRWKVRTIPGCHGALAFSANAIR